MSSYFLSPPLADGRQIATLKYWEAVKLSELVSDLRTLQDKPVVDLTIVSQLEVEIILPADSLPRTLERLTLKGGRFALGALVGFHQLVLDNTKISSFPQNLDQLRYSSCDWTVFSKLPAQLARRKLRLITLIFEPCGALNPTQTFDIDVLFKDLSEVGNRVVFQYDD